MIKENLLSHSHTPKKVRRAINTRPIKSRHVWGRAPGTACLLRPGLPPIS